MISMLEAPLPNPDRAASELLVRSEQVRAPTDLERIFALWPNLRVTETELDGEGVFLDGGPGGGIIFIREDIGELRKRFTAAHELGHFVVLEELRRSDADRSWLTGQLLERWCDKFAAGLLLPKDWVLGYLRGLRLHELSEGILRAPSIFKVSNKAFRYRVREVAEMSIFVVELRGSILAVREKFQSANPALSWSEKVQDIIREKRCSTTWEQIEFPCGESVVILRWFAKASDEQTGIILVLPAGSAGRAIT